MQSEKEIQKEIIDALLQHPKVALVWQNDVGKTGSRKFGYGKYRPKGLPDITGALKGGRGFLLEVKTPEGKASAEQIAFLSKASAAGILAGIVRSVLEAEELFKTA